MTSPERSSTGRAFCAGSASVLAARDGDGAAAEPGAEPRGARATAEPVEPLRWWSFVASAGATVAKPELRSELGSVANVATGHSAAIRAAAGGGGAE